MICGKILLYKPDWEITYICELCYQELLTLPELLKHVFHEHVKDVPEDKLREFCGDIKLESDIEIGPETLTQPMVVTNQVKQEQQDIESKEEVAKDEYNHIEPAKPVASEQQQDDPAESEEFEFFDMQQKRKQSTNISNKNTAYGIEAHKKIHGDKPYVCEHCGARFADKNNMQVHCYRHLGIKRHSCSVCKKAFTTSTELKSHMRTHTGERPYECRDCTKAFKSSTQFAAHRRRHTNERRFLCSECGKSFKDNHTLKEHVACHATKRPFNCTECDANFKLHKGLRQHMLLHSGVKKYSCEICGKKFAQQAGVYSHVKVHKNESKK